MTFPKSVLVFGHQGQVATCLRQAPWPAGWTVVALSRQDADLTDPRQISRAINREPWSAIVNAAAYTAVDRAETEPDAAFAINRDAPAAIAEMAAERKIPLIHLSTDYVFSGAQSGAYRETDPIGPIGVYARSKAEGEAAVIDRHPQAVVLRTSWVYSPFGQNFVKTMIRLAGERERLSVVDDQTGSPTAAADLAAAIIAILPRLTEPAAAPLRFGIFHYCGEGVTSWFGFARTIMAELARRGRRVPDLVPIPTSAYPTPAQRPANSVLDCSRFDDRFGIARRSWPVALDQCMSELCADR